MQKKIFIGFLLTLIIVIFIPVYWATEPGRQKAASENFKAAAAAPTPAPTPTPKADTAALKAKGEEIFQKTAGGVGCQYCHGKDAKGGNLGPDIRGKTGEEIIGALGRDPMTFIYLTDEEIEAVAIYLKYLQSQP